jgi:hypothetical protein
MVKKLKVVDVEAAKQPSEEIVEEKPAEEVIEESQPEVEEKQEEPQTPEAPPAEQPAQESKKKEQQYITCQTCNKNMLMKTYKYSHQKLCNDKNAPPAPPPPPPPLPPPPEPKPKRVAKPKEPKPETKPEPKQENQCVVSFNEFNTPPDPYKAMREQRLIARHQRVKHLISQAI